MAAASFRLGTGDVVRLFRAYAGWVILAFFFAWPPIHMLLARQYHFSTWRYGGWGMYATPDGSDREVHVFISSCEPQGAAPVRDGGVSDRKLGSYYLVEGARLDSLILPELDPLERRALAQLIKDIRSLSRPGDYERLAAWIDARVSLVQEPPASLGILLIQPHLDASVAYAEVVGFIRERGRWSPVPPMRGPAALSTMIARVGICP